LWYYHVTPFRNLQSIGQHGLLNGKHLQELSLGEQTTGWESGEQFIHVTNDLAKAVRWFREVFLMADVPFQGWWAIIRFEASAVAIPPRQDPKSETGLIFGLDRIPPEALSYRFGSDYEDGQGDEVNGVSIWIAVAF
jgi:hypothetical protein